MSGGCSLCGGREDFKSLLLEVHFLISFFPLMEREQDDSNSFQDYKEGRALENWFWHESILCMGQYFVFW